MNEGKKSLEDQLYCTLSRKSTVEEIQKFIDDGVAIVPGVLAKSIEAGANVNVIKTILRSLAIVPAFSGTFDLAARRNDTREVEEIIRCLVEHGVGFDCARNVDKNKARYSKEIVELLWLAGHLDPEGKGKNIKPEYIIKKLSEDFQVVQRSGFWVAIFYPIRVIWSILRTLYEVNFGKKK